MWLKKILGTSLGWIFLIVLLRFVVMAIPNEKNRPYRWIDSIIETAYQTQNQEVRQMCITSLVQLAKSSKQKQEYILAQITQNKKLEGEPISKELQIRLQKNPNEVLLSILKTLQPSWGHFIPILQKIWIAISILFLWIIPVFILLRFGKVKIPLLYGKLATQKLAILNILFVLLLICHLLYGFSLFFIQIFSITHSLIIIFWILRGPASQILFELSQQQVLQITFVLGLFFIATLIPYTFDSVSPFSPNELEIALDSLSQEYQNNATPILLALLHQHEHFSWPIVEKMFGILGKHAEATCLPNLSIFLENKDPHIEKLAIYTIQTILQKK